MGKAVTYTGPHGEFVVDQLVLKAGEPTEVTADELKDVEAAFEMTAGDHTYEVDQNYTAPEPQAAEEQDDPRKAYDERPKDDLADEATSRGLDVEGLSKDEIIDALLGADAPQGTPGGPGGGAPPPPDQP